MQTDAFKGITDSPIAPAEYCFAISPSDTAELERATKALYVGTAGDVTLTSVRGNGPVTFANVPSGAILDVRTKAVLTTGTTASDIVGLA